MIFFSCFWEYDLMLIFALWYDDSIFLLVDARVDAEVLGRMLSIFHLYTLSFFFCDAVSKFCDAFSYFRNKKACIWC